MKKIVMLNFLGLFFFLTISGAQAELVYNNGFPNGPNGNEMTYWIQAEDFTLTSSQTVTDVRFWAFPYPNPQFPDESYLGYLGSIVWQIYIDNNGQPDSLLASGSVVPIQASYQYDFYIGPQALPAGNYWLGLHNGPLNTYDIDLCDFYWQTTDSNGTVTGHEFEPDGVNTVWRSNFSEHAFQLYSNTVPLPGAIWLVGSGLLGIMGWRRFSKG